MIHHAYCTYKPAALNLADNNNAAYPANSKVQKSGASTNKQTSEQRSDRSLKTASPLIKHEQSAPSAGEQTRNLKSELK